MAIVRWLGPWVQEPCNVYSWPPPPNPSSRLPLPPKLRYGYVPECVPDPLSAHARYSIYGNPHYACANRELPRSRLPYLKNRIAAHVPISTAGPRYWDSRYNSNRDSKLTKRRHRKRNEAQQRTRPLIVQVWEHFLISHRSFAVGQTKRLDWSTLTVVHLNTE